MNDLEKHMQSAEALIVHIQPDLYVPMAQEVGKLHRDLVELTEALRRFRSSLQTAAGIEQRHRGKELSAVLRSDLAVYAQKRVYLQACCQVVIDRLTACDRLIESRAALRTFADNVRYYNLLRAMKLSMLAHECLADAVQVVEKSPDFSHLLAEDYLQMLDKWRQVSGSSLAPPPPPLPNGLDFLE